MPPKSNKNHQTPSHPTMHQPTEQPQQQQQQQQQQHQQNNKPIKSSAPASSASSSSSSSSSSHPRRVAINQFAQAVHLVEGFADTLDAIPPSLTRSLSDLKELDAVLSGPLKLVHSTLDQLVDSIANPHSIQPTHRLQLLRTIVSDVEKFKLGAQDKIRVANGTCQSLSHHIRQLDTTTSLLISSLPPSLESRIPASSFPSGYPQLTGSLRSKPIGGVWHDLNPRQHPPQSPPSMPARQFINFDHHPTLLDPESSAPIGEPQPPPKRPKLIPSSSSTQPNPIHLDDPITRHHHQGSQDHLSSDPKSQQSIGLALTGKSTTTDKPSLQNSQSDLARASLTTNAPVGKNKRPRISSNLLEADSTPALPSPTNKPNPTSQSLNHSTIVGTKKRMRKNQPPVGPIGKTTDPSAQVSQGNLSKLAEQNSNGFPASLSLSALPTKPPPASTNFPSSGVAARKTAASVGRQSGGVSNSINETPAAAPAPTKRAYTKRNGLTNGSSSTALPKNKRANTKKSATTISVSATTIEPDLSSNQLLRENLGGRKTENQPRKGAAKESIRLEDVVEGASKARPRSRSNNPTHEAESVSTSKSERDGRRMSRDPSENMMDDHPLTGDLGGGGDRIETDDEEELVNGIDEEGSNRTMVKPVDSKPTITHIRGALTSSTRKRKEGDEDQPPRGRRRRRRRRRGGEDHHDQVIDEHDDEGGEDELAEVQSNDSHTSSAGKSYCICDGQVYSDRMVACDNTDCPIEWFHYQCAGLTEDPTGNWFCGDCRKKGKGKRRKKEDEEEEVDLKEGEANSSPSMTVKDSKEPKELIKNLKVDEQSMNLDPSSVVIPSRLQPKTIDRGFNENDEKSSNDMIQSSNGLSILSNVSSTTTALPTHTHSNNLDHHLNPSFT